MSDNVPLLRLYELPAVGGAAMVSGSFGTGALAAFVATPCAGPFLGAALGTALLLPIAGSVLIFAALGLGLAIGHSGGNRHPHRACYSSRHGNGGTTLGPHWSVRVRKCI